MQALDIISVNFWHILISLCNLIILFLLLKKFLYKPVTKAVKKREDEIKAKYDEADRAQENADRNAALYQAKLDEADDTARQIIKDATDSANARGDKIIADANDRAGSIIRTAETQAQLEYKKARAEIKSEIVDVSTALAEKLIERRLTEEDHREIIDSFIEKMGDSDEIDN